MALLEKVCPSCGRKESERRHFLGGFCSECYASRFNIFGLPSTLEFRTCPRCGRGFLNGEWVEYDEDDLAEWLVERVKSKIPVASADVEFSQAKGGLQAQLKLVFDADGVKLEKHAQARVAFDRNLCSDCHKKSGGYHEAVVQLRGKNFSRLRQLAAGLMAACKRSSFVSGYEEKKEGIDFLVGSRSGAMKAIADSGMRFTVSNKLTGVREGKRLFRATVCIRL